MSIPPVEVVTHSLSSSEYFEISISEYQLKNKNSSFEMICDFSERLTQPLHLALHKCLRWTDLVKYLKEYIPSSFKSSYQYDFLSLLTSSPEPFKSYLCHCNFFSIQLLCFIKDMAKCDPFDFFDIATIIITPKIPHNMKNLVIAMHYLNGDINPILPTPLIHDIGAMKLIWNLKYSSSCESCTTLAIKET